MKYSRILYHASASRSYVTDHINNALSPFVLMILRKELIAPVWNECICHQVRWSIVEREEDSLFKRVDVNLPPSYVQRLQKPLESKHGSYPSRDETRREIDAIPLSVMVLFIHIAVFSGNASVKHLREAAQPPSSPLPFRRSREGVNMWWSRHAVLIITNRAAYSDDLW
jgi:hypothetical protein